MCIIIYLNKYVITFIIKCVYVQISVERYYSTVIIVDYQLQTLLHFSDSIRTEPCKYCMYLLKQPTIMFVLLVHSLLYNLMTSASSVETNMLDAVDNLDISEHHLKTKMDEQSEKTTDSVQQGVQLIFKK